jgi:hypothetical protein
LRNCCMKKTSANSRCWLDLRKESGGARLKRLIS